MKKINIQRVIIVAGSIILIYLLISLYFLNHFFFHTTINGVDVSGKAYGEANRIIKEYIEGYKLQLIERDGETDEITGLAIEMRYNENNNIPQIYGSQNSLNWFGSLFKTHSYYVVNLYRYDKDKLGNEVNSLNCFLKRVTNPKSASFQYAKGSYTIIDEVYGNKVLKGKLLDTVKAQILQGKKRLDMKEMLCYENPKYTISSDKTFETLKLLNKYVASKIIYKFGSRQEIIDGTTINKWLSADQNMKVTISRTAVMNYVKGLSNQYDTVGATRSFVTSVGKIVEVKGGLYGWRIDQEGETKALMKNIKSGEVVEKEPLYVQTALYRGDDEIGNTYIEINITKQHLWFYKEGRLKIQGSVVTGNPNKGNATVIGTYMLIYKQKDAVLKGPGYEADVTYWMPFFGNMGVHDASWRHSFGGEIYKNRGTHGCVNAPFYLAKIIFEHIDEGTPVIIYEE